jgi:hypothetical protein
MTTAWWFGSPPLPEAKYAWGARAIFKPSDQTYSLDILPDRQGHFMGDPPDEAGYKEFVEYMNSHRVMPQLQRVARKFDTSSTKKFVLHFPWKDDSMVMVAAGTPNGSYGYFYIGVSLVPKDKAPAEEGPIDDSLHRRISKGLPLNEEEQYSLIFLLGHGCREKTKAALRAAAARIPHVTNAGIFERVQIQNDRVSYCAGQSYPDEIRTVRECLVG